MLKWPLKIERILEEGLSLGSFGINNWALTKEQALNSLESLVNIQVPVLGGDVYENIGGVIQSNYDSWHCEPISDELKYEFVKRSILIAKEYINNYKSPHPDRIYFVLVPDENNENFFNQEINNESSP